MSERPILYTLSNCPTCTKAKRDLKKAKVDYEERQVDSNSAWYEEALNYAATVPMLSFFMLKDREKYAGAITRILRRKGGRAASDFAVNVAHVLSGYVLGELFVVLITACITTAGLLVLHVPYSYVLGPLAGLCVLLPYVGVTLVVASGVIAIEPAREFELHARAARVPDLERGLRELQTLAERLVPPPDMPANSQAPSSAVVA